MVIGHATGPDESTLARTSYGSLVFSAAPKGSLIITANEALCPLPENAATVAQVWIVNRKELRNLRAARALEFSYRGESQTIPEGNYRVILDPRKGKWQRRIKPDSRKHLEASSNVYFGGDRRCVA